MTKTRPRGCLLQLGKGRWRPVVTVGYVTDPATGKKKQKQRWFPVFEGGKREAQDHLATLIDEAKAGETVLPTRETLGEYLTRWLRDEIMPPRAAKNTYYSFRTSVVKHIIPRIGHVRLQELTRAHVKAFLREMETTQVCRGKGAGRLMKKSTVGVVRDVLHTALADAVEDDLVRRNPATLRHKARRKHRRDESGRGSRTMRPRPKAWNESEQRALIAAAQAEGEQLHALVRLALDSGMRRSEILGLRWADFAPQPKPHGKDWRTCDPAEVTVTVRRQLAYAGADAIDNCAKLAAGDDDTDWRRAMFAAPKSRRERSLNLTPATVEALRSHYRNQKKFRFNNRVRDTLDLVFARELGGVKDRPGQPIHRSALEREFKRIVAAAAVTPLSFHSCRHSTATGMLLRGVAPVVVAKHLGHANTTVTMAIYAHCLPAAEHEAAKVRAALLGERN